MPLAGFTYSRVVIVQSLEPQEVETGRILSEYLEGLLQRVEEGRPVQILNCGYADQFLEIIRGLISDAGSGDIPLLHVECHGDPVAGLEFANGSTLPWKQVADALLPLNVATRFNLLAVFSACFGAHFLGQMGAVEPAPCWCLVAPTEQVDPGEILSGFRVFYSALLEEADLGDAVRAISKCRLSHGEWLWEPAELWYQRTVTGYVKVHCTEVIARQRAKTIYREARKQGARVSVGATLRLLKKRNRELLTGDYFDRYFMTEAIPENRTRFAEAKERVALTLASLRGVGKYVV